MPDDDTTLAPPSIRSRVPPNNNVTGDFILAAVAISSHEDKRRIEYGRVGKVVLCTMQRLLGGANLVSDFVMSAPTIINAPPTAHTTDVITIDVA